MSQDIPQQSVKCDGCQKEIRRNQAVMGYGIEFPNFAQEYGIDKGEEVKICPECGKNIDKITV